MTIPQNYFGGEKAIWVQSGWTHCAVGITSGEVYMWGRSDYGQLGSSDKDDSCSETTPEISSKTRFNYVPSCLMLNKNIRSIVCGSEHNLALTEDSSDSNLLHSWGWNEHGNCGDGSTINVSRPLKLAIPGNVQMIGAGSGHSFALVKTY